MRGEGVDGLHSKALEEAKALAVDGALDDVREMHISVIDGVFPGNLLASQNLTFSMYEMPEDRNKPRWADIRSADLTTWVERK